MTIPMPLQPCRRFEANIAGRDFVVGDVHGHFELLERFMLKVNFDTAVDRLFAVGDLVDRGPDSNQVIEWLLHPWFASVRGNHEQMIIDCLDGTGDIPRHCKNGGAWFQELDEAEQARIAVALRSLPFAIEIAQPQGGSIGLVHAEPPVLEGQPVSWAQVWANLLGREGDEVQQQAARLALYSRRRIEARDTTPVAGVEAIYLGHTSVADVHTLGNVVYLDTGCSWSDGRLTGLQILNHQPFSIEYLRAP